MAEDTGTQASPSPTDEEMADQLRSIKVADIVVQATAGLVSLGFVRLSGDQRDLDQARLAIDCLKALEPVLRDQVSKELAEDLSRTVVSLQLAYADAVSPKSEPAAPATSEPETEGGEQAPADASGASE